MQHEGRAARRHVVEHLWSGMPGMSTVKALSTPTTADPLVLGGDGEMAALGMSQRRHGDRWRQEDAARQDHDRAPNFSRASASV